MDRRPVQGSIALHGWGPGAGCDRAACEPSSECGAPRSRGNEGFGPSDENPDGPSTRKLTRPPQRRRPAGRPRPNPKSYTDDVRPVFSQKGNNDFGPDGENPDGPSTRNLTRPPQRWRPPGPPRPNPKSYTDDVRPVFSPKGNQHTAQGWPAQRGLPWVCVPTNPLLFSCRFVAAAGEASGCHKTEARGRYDDPRVGRAARANPGLWAGSPSGNNDFGPAGENPNGPSTRKLTRPPQRRRPPGPPRPNPKSYIPGRAGACHSTLKVTRTTCGLFPSGDGLGDRVQHRQPATLRAEVSAGAVSTRKVTRTTRCLGSLNSQSYALRSAQALFQPAKLHGPRGV